MTAFAISSGSIEYYDQKTGGSVNATLDTYTISNESTLVVRTDTYACANHSIAAGSLDTVSFSGVGGELKFDPTYVRVIAYTSGSGNSPAYGATISQGGVSGEFLGAWADWQTDAVAAGSAIPSAGFIKIGGVTGGNFAAGALTGITATCSGADVQGWIEIRGSQSSNASSSRIGKITSTLAWFELGVTTGSRGQIVPCPTTGNLAGIFAGCWIETSPGSDVYEKFVGVGSPPATAGYPTDETAMWVWHTTSGLRIGSDGANNVGFLPPAGCKIRIPATILTNCIRSVSGSGARVVPHATLGTRHLLSFGGGGYLDFNGVVCQWYLNVDSAYYVRIRSSTVNDTIRSTKVATPFVYTNLIIAATQQQTANNLLNVSGCPFGGNVDDVYLNLYTQNANYQRCAVFGTSNSLVINKLKFGFSLQKTVSTEGIYFGNCSSVELTDTVAVTGYIYLTICDNVVIDGYRHYDGLVAMTGSIQASAFSVSSCIDVIIKNVEIPDRLRTFYSMLAALTANTRIRFVDCGTPGSPLDIALSRWVISSQGSNKNVEVKRVYITGSTQPAIVFTDSDSYVDVENVDLGFSDVSYARAQNMSMKSVGCSASTTVASSVYGTHWMSKFTSNTAGVLELSLNEPTQQTANEIIIVAGSPVFNGGGSILMTVVGQQIIAESPGYFLGFTSLANAAISFSGVNQSNHSYEFQYDIGSGYNGTWLTCNGTNFAAVGVIDPTVGIRIKLRVTCTTANATNRIANIRINAVTDFTSRTANLYPLDTITLTFTNLIAGSDVVVRAAGTSTILASVDSNAGTTWAYVYETPVAIDVDVIKPGYVPKSLLRNYTPSAQNSSLPVSQLLDRNYI